MGTHGTHIWKSLRISYGENMSNITSFTCFLLLFHRSNLLIVGGITSTRTFRLHIIYMSCISMYIHCTQIITQLMFLAYITILYANTYTQMQGQSVVYCRVLSIRCDRISSLEETISIQILQIHGILFRMMHINICSSLFEYIYLMSIINQSIRSIQSIYQSHM